VALWGKDYPNLPNQRWSGFLGIGILADESANGSKMGSTHVDINPETTWSKVKKWPSAVLAEFALRIQEELHKRAVHRKETLSRNKGGNPEQKLKKHKASSHRPPSQRGKLRRRGKLDQESRK